jgi:hypothetical protein
MDPLPYKIVWIASLPRSGSMWAFNIARRLLSEAGFSVFPRTVPKSDEEMVAAARKGMRDVSPENVWCLKVHSGLRNASPANRFISTFRDPRDALVSFMRFMRVDFEHALTACVIWTQLCDHYRAFPPHLSLPLEYDSLATQPMQAAACTNTFLGLNLPEHIIASAVAEFERDKVRRDIDALVENVVRGQVADDIDITEALIVNADGSMRFCDPKTGFQSRHVSDYRDGDWRILLNENEKTHLDQKIGDWLTRQGFDREANLQCGGQNAKAPRMTREAFF